MKDIPKNAKIIKSILKDYHPEAVNDKLWLTIQENTIPKAA